MRISDLLGLEMRTEAGRSLGSVRDVRAELRPRSLTVTGLVVGGFGVLERLGLGAPESTARVRTRDVVRWNAVVRADRRGIVVKDDAEAV
jgi:sporulation protein YlmC with PRC-barrel domain